MNPTSSVDPMNPATVANLPRSNYTPLIDRRTLGSWVENTLFAPKPTKPIKTDVGASGMPKQKLAYNPSVPKATQFFRVYETQTTKVDIPLKLLSEEDT